MIKYFDRVSMAPLDITNPSLCCTYETWNSSYDKYICAKHPTGFLIFLNPDQINKCDEYSVADPYDVEINLSSDFQQRRIRCTLELLKRIGKLGAKLLDVGCGQGHLTRLIYDNYPGMEVSGIDYSLSAINFAAEKCNAIDYAVADAYHLPYIRGYFDIVICNNIWEHVADPLKLLSGVKRVTRPGGWLIISTPSRYRIENLLRVFRGRSVLMQSSLHVTEYTVGQVIEQLSYSGYEVIDVISEPITRSLNSMNELVVYKVIKPVLEYLLKFFRSHHSLESTVFFLAREMERETVKE